MHVTEIVSQPLFNLPPNIPSLHPAETLYSWSGAVHAWNGNHDVRQTSLQLFGSPSAALIHDFPSQLATLQERLGGILGSLESVALGHSLIGYFLPTQSPQNCLRVWTAVRSGGLGSLKYVLGIPASRVGGYHPLKGCAECIADDSRAFGRAVWRVHHQHPSTIVCTRHRALLRYLRHRQTPVHRRGWSLPTMGLARDWLDYPKLSGKQISRLSHLAEMSAGWSALAPSSIDPVFLGKTYRLALMNHGFTTSEESLRLRFLLPEVRSHFEGMECIPEFKSLFNVTAQWAGFVGSVARVKPKRAHPAKHLLLLSMLFETFETFLESYTTAAAERPEAVRAKQTDIPCDDKKQLFYQLVQEGHSSLRAAAMKIGITNSTAVVWAKQANVTFVRRPKSLTKETLESARELLRAGFSKARIRAVCNISQTSLDRLISSEPNLGSEWHAKLNGAKRDATRRSFLRLMKLHRGWTVKQIRTIEGNGYMWLYRNDRDWLLANLPSLWTKTK